MGGHDWFDGFDKRVCYGDHPAADGECPKLKKGAVDRCGVCGCTIFGLSMSETSPSDCERRSLHRPQTDGGQPRIIDDEDAPDARARLVQSASGWSTDAIDADPETMVGAPTREQAVGNYVTASSADDYLIIEVGRSYNVTATHPATGQRASMTMLEYALRKVASRLAALDDAPQDDNPDVDTAWDLIELDRSDADWRASHLFTGVARLGESRADAVSALADTLESHTWL